MYGRAHTKILKFRPQRIVVWMREVMPLDEHRANHDPPKTGDLRDSAQLLDCEVHVLKGNHRGGEEPLGCGFAKVLDPVIVATGKRVSSVRVFHQMESLG